MIGITSFGVYIPLHRMGPETKGWGSKIERTVGYYDEDSLTMGVAAALDCIVSGDRNRIDGLYFASTTAPYKEKLTAATIAITCDLRNEIQAMDIGNTLRAGTTAIKMASDAVKAGSANNVLVAASECGRIGQSRDQFERNSGDGSAAFLIGSQNVIAEIKASGSVSNELLDVWRLDGDKYVRSWESRFVVEEGYLKTFHKAVCDFLEKQKLAPGDIDKAVLYAPDGRRHMQMTGKLGLSAEQTPDPFFGIMGNTGAAFVPMLLVAALDEAAPGDRILVAGYGDGVDILLLEVTENIGKTGGGGLKDRFAGKLTIPDYETYLNMRHNTPGGDYYPPAAPSVSAIARERDVIFRLYGGECESCGTLQYPPQRICSRCGAKDRARPVRLSDRKAKVFTYTLDNLAQIPVYDLPMVDSIIDFEGGGRGCFQMTDRNPEEVAVGLEVEMTFRKLHTAADMNNYFWKCRPVRKTGRDEESR
ncbi:MAG: 3-oxoacyl-[acyl-carrier-protein] synthase III C-terminal domain-containing protein [Acidobacteriota bacterium]